MDNQIRLKELVESANVSDAMYGAPLDVDECKIIFDYGWTHALSVVSRGLCLVEVRNTGWSVTSDSDEAIGAAYDEE